MPVCDLTSAAIPADVLRPALPLGLLFGDPLSDQRFVRLKGVMTLLPHPSGASDVALSADAGLKPSIVFERRNRPRIAVRGGADYQMPLT